MSLSTTLPDTDPAQFLKVASQGASIASHADLWQWLQGSVQELLPHDVMLVGWGDFHSGELKFDIVSSLPAMRSQNWSGAALTPLLNYFRDCWVAAQQQPCLLDMVECARLLRAAANDTSPIEAMARMRSALVHGIAGSQRGSDRVFVSLSLTDDQRADSGPTLKLLVPFIDSALRRMPPAPHRHLPCLRQPQQIRVAPLSERERQIMDWVAMGKTNPEIGCILSISEFTVKNHMKSIFSKLDVTNRAQAVSKLTRMTAYA